MTEVICDRASCANYLNGYCTLAAIEIDGGECCDYCYDGYKKGKDYQTEYFIVWTDCKEKWRKRCQGKRIIINGEEFFTEDDDRQNPEAVRVTHGRTGVYAGTVKSVQEHWDEIVKRAAGYPDVMTLPLRESTETEVTV